MVEHVDVVVVGARVAGAPTAMLLAQRGLRVVLVDRARLPSDAVSSHQIQVAGTAALARWGLYDAALGDGACAARQVRLDLDGVTLTSPLPRVEGHDRILSPRRLRLDELLVEAAAQAGVDVRTRFAVEAVEREGGRAVGISGREASGPRIRVAADLVVGADGKHSPVARSVGARVLRSRSAATVALYAYWEGVPLGAAELHHRRDLAVAAFPTDDGRTVTFVAAPAGALDQARRDPRAFVTAALRATTGQVGRAIGDARLVERVRLTPDLPHRELQPAGPGWALVGDAAMVLDPVTAYGMTHAFLGAEMLDAAVGAAGERGERLDARLGEYAAGHRARFGPMFDLTSALARLAPRSSTAVLMRRIAADPELSAEVLAVFGGLAPPSSLFGPTRIARILGLRGLVGVARGELTSRLPGRAGPPSEAGQAT